MATDNKEVWIKTGYEIFARSGHTGLKVEPLAKRVGISKSSFYHHFADVEIFIDSLLAYHLEQSHVIAGKERRANNIDPDLINILLAHRHDLLFNRQLRINQNIPAFAKALSQSNKIVGDAFIVTWVKDLDSSLSRKQIEGVFALALENFFLQLNDHNLNYEWLSAYFSNLKKITDTLV